MFPKKVNVNQRVSYEITLKLNSEVMSFLRISISRPKIPKTKAQFWHFQDVRLFFSYVIWIKAIFNVTIAMRNVHQKN